MRRWSTFFRYSVTGQHFSSFRPATSMNVDDMWTMDSGYVPPVLQLSPQKQLTRSPLTEEARARQNEKRRARYAAKHSKKARQARILAEKEALAKEVAKLRRAMKEKEVPIKKRKKH
jgi:hypothetical protein